MPEAPRRTAAEAEAMLLIHGSAVLHPKTIQQVIEAIEETSAP
jgi:hypothetical protein